MLRQDTEILPLWVSHSLIHAVFLSVSLLLFFNFLLLPSPTFAFLIPLITDTTSDVYYKKPATCDF